MMEIYDGFYGDLSKFDLERYRAKNEKERWDDCWISPKGKWYNVAFGCHQGFAYRIVYLMNPPKPEDELHHVLEMEDKASEMIIKLGWIMIERDSGFGVTFRGYENMTTKQYKVLLTHFKDKRLFRGWTIRGLWLLKEETKEQAKED